MRSGATPSARQRRTRFVPPCTTMAARRPDAPQRSPGRTATRARKATRDLAARKLIAGNVGRPRRVRVGVERLISSPVRPSRCPITNLPQRGPLDGHEAIGFGDDRSAPTGPDKIARVHRVEGGCRQVFGNGGDLPLAEHDRGTSRCPMKRRVSAPTTLQWRTR